MIHPEVRRDLSASASPTAEPNLPAEPTGTGAPQVSRAAARWEARIDLERYRAETERMRVLAEFLGRPVHAHGGTEPDPDIITAYNLAVEAALHGIRRAATGG